ncbi:MAG: NAD-dependent epimerase/dehydratase family protein [Deltaproteobacteria bacterium]|nr:NAD-dependent epimerase/dehydratase family protein [Deltaproteobacteria bacterium]
MSANDENDRTSKGYPAVITGGAGFIGSNLADRLLGTGRKVLVLDDLSRPTSAVNLTWLRERHGPALETRTADVRDPRAVEEAVARASAVFHLATANETSDGSDPMKDFDVDARGTLNLLEAIRKRGATLPLIHASTVKVYRALGPVELRDVGSRCEPVENELREHGIPETRVVDPRGPHGCSKGAAEQYVLDYARTRELRAVVLRLGTVYGPRQFGTEEQGFVSHLVARAADSEAVTLRGDGRQVRDLLWIDDLVDALLGAHRVIDTLAGNAYNVGGGPANSVSLLELLERIERLEWRQPQVRSAPAHAEDPRYSVCDWRSFGSAIAWAPRVGVQEGLERLHEWVLSAGRRRTPATAMPPESGDSVIEDRRVRAS